MATRRIQPVHTQRTTAAHMTLGREGEKRAAAYLKRKGYRIVEQNVRAGGVEIDLVVRRGRTVVFVEVKTRRSRRFGPAELAVDARKQSRLIRGAVAWLARKGRGVARARFDVIAWEVGSGSTNHDHWKCRHLEGAFEAEPDDDRKGFV